MRSSLTQLWDAMLAGNPSTDNLVVLALLAAVCIGCGLLLAWDEARARRAS